MFNFSKNTILSLISVIFLIVVIAMIFVRGLSTTSTVSEQVPPIATGTQFPAAPNEASVLTKAGTQLATRNFLMDTDVILWDKGEKTYLIAQEASTEGDLYQIFYFAGGGITVSLLDINMGYARSRAEQALIKKLELPTNELCSLMIRVTAPRFVSELYSGRELGLSFCPGAVALE